MLSSTLLFAWAAGAFAYEEAPSLDAFRRRALGAISVLDDYLYLEGGEVSQLIPDSSDPDQLTSDPQFSRASNVTLSVSLKESWSTDQVHFREIQRKNKHNVKDNAMWADEKNGRLFQWDGQGSWGDDTSANDIVLWMFTPDGSGGGKWTIELPEDEDFYNTLTKMSSGAGAVCGRQAFLLGGYVNRYSDAYVESKAGFPVPGMLSLDMDTIGWHNESLAPAAPAYGSLIKSRAVCVTGFSKPGKGKQTDKGGRNLLFSLGGKTTSPDQPVKGEAMNMGNITFYDVDEEKWYWQTTTGDKPDGRWEFCAAGVEGPDGTYEIFLYGGENNNTPDLDDVWVLTIPGFHWVKADIESPKRRSHDCAIVGPGQWQLLSSGGISDDGWYSEDEWANGLGVLDLNEMKWNDKYEVSKEKTYKGPESVQKWYQDGGLKRVVWDNAEVAAMFANAGPQGTGSSDDTDAKDDESTTSDDSESTADGEKKDEEKKEDTTPLHAIIGGVVGGVVALALIGLLIFCLRRRKARRSTSPLPSANPDSPQPAPAAVMVAGDADPTSPASTTDRTYTADSAGIVQAQKLGDNSPGAQTSVTPIAMFSNPHAQELGTYQHEKPLPNPFPGVALPQQQQHQHQHYQQQPYPQQQQPGVQQPGMQQYQHYQGHQHPFYAANAVVSPQSAGEGRNCPPNHYAASEMHGNYMPAEMPGFREVPSELDGECVRQRQ